jgi:ADP-ribosyl-[dinitrogen reductase] hydrolase
MAEQVCMITHQNQLCVDSSKTYALALVESINEGTGGEELVGYLKVCAAKYHFDERILTVLKNVSKTKAASPVGKDKDSVLNTLQIVLKTLLETSSFEAGMKQMVIKGGSACSNAAIYGSLAGAFYGPEAIPDRWVAELQATDSLTRFLRKQSAHRRFNMNLETMASDLATRLLKN